MALLQALIALIGRSAGKILNAIFGWAVNALFGPRSGHEQTLLAGVVAMAALWPLLLIGVVAPRAAAFLVAFVPLPETVPESAVRWVWIGLTVVVPLIVGMALAAKGRPGTVGESRVKRLALGYPTTLALAIAFWISFVAVPLIRLSSMARGRTDAQVPIVTDAEGYDDAAARIHGVLNAHDFALVPAEPGMWAQVPMTVLRTLGGPAFRDWVPERLAYFAGPTLEVTLHPNSLLLRGPGRTLPYAQGLVAEALTKADVFQTTQPETQDIERQIRRVWRVLDENPAAHTGSPWLRSRLGDVVADISRVEATYDEWQIVYRQALQLARALDGEPQLLTRNEEGGMPMEPRENGSETWRERSTIELVRSVARTTSTLLGKEVELARTELKNDFAAEMSTVKSLAIAAVAGILTLNMLLVAAVFALQPWMYGQVAALLIAGATLVVALVAGVIGWRRHVKQPLDRTRKTLVDDLRWAKEELA